MLLTICYHFKLICSKSIVMLAKEDRLIHITVFQKKKKFIFNIPPKNLLSSCILYQSDDVCIVRVLVFEGGKCPNIISVFFLPNKSRWCKYYSISKFLKPLFISKFYKNETQIKMEFCMIYLLLFQISKNC